MADPTDLMITDPETFAFRYPTWACRVSTATNEDLPGGSFSSPPDKKSDISTTLKPLRVVRTAGGQQLDYADIEVVTNSPLIDRSSQPATFTKMVDVLFPDNPEYVVSEVGGVPVEIGQGQNTRLIVGDYVEEAESVTSGESLSGRVEVRPYHYGKVFGGMLVQYNETDTIMELTGTPAVFNPMIDGVIRGNRSDKKNGDDDEDPYLWMDPEIDLTTYAAVFHNQSASEWTLEQAVKAIIKACNEDEFFVEYLEGVFVNTPAIRNVTLETGHYLPYYLDALLHPHGYNWYLNPDRYAENAGDVLEYEKPRINIFRKGYGEQKKLFFQKPGERLDLSKSNVNQYDIRRRIADAVTAVRVFGDYLRAEVTLPLYPGWKADKDELTVDSLAIDEGAEYKENKMVHRLWVANEGADYSYMRSAPDTYPIGDPPDLSEIFGISYGDTGDVFLYRYASKTLARRRLIDAPLTFQGTTDSRVRRDLLVEFSVDGGATWKELTSDIAGFSVLADRIGIIFTGNYPPDVLVDAFHDDENLKLRITGTIASDHHLYNVKTDLYVDGSVQGRLNMSTIHAHDRFRHWFVVGKPSPDRPELEDHEFASVLKDDDAGADVHDDRAELQTYAAEIIKPMLHAEYDGNFVIPGWTTYYNIGDLLTTIEGRNVTLNQAASGDRYMQITGIEWSQNDEEGPETKLMVDRGIAEYNDPGSSRDRYQPHTSKNRSRKHYDVAESARHPLTGQPIEN